MATKVFGSPATYVQGKDMLHHSAEYLKRLGTNLLVMGGEPPLGSPATSSTT